MKWSAANYALNIPFRELWKGLLLKAQMHVLLWARMRNQTTADPKKSNQQFMQKCEHRNINAFYLFHCQSERKVKKGDACWEWETRGEPPECEMKMEEMWWISGTHTQRGENRGQKSQHRTSSHLKTCFSSDEPLLAGSPAPEAVPGSVNREKKNYYSLPQTAYLWIITPLWRLTEMPGELKAPAASSNSFCFLCYYSFYLHKLRKIWTR